MGSKRNILVVGCGHWGKNLVRNFSELGVLAAVCDPDVKLSGKMSAAYNVPAVTFDDGLHDPVIEGVVLAVPAPLHSAMAIQAMEAGKHVFVEKPLAMNAGEAREMIVSAQANGCQIMVGHLLQYHPIFLKLVDLIQDGLLGELNYVYSNRLSLGKVRSEENVIWSFAPHDISMVLRLAGEAPQDVKTRAVEILQPGIADSAIIHMTFNSGLSAHISVSWLHPDKEQKLVVVGSKAMAVFDDTKDWSEKLAIYYHEVAVNAEGVVLVKNDPIFVDVEHSEPLREECAHFVEVVTNNMVPRTGGEEGRLVLEVLSRASEVI